MNASDEWPRFVMLETEETFLALAPKPTPEEREANLAELRVLAKTDPTMAAWLDLIDSNGINVDAVIRNRGYQAEPWDASR